jgi:hypothetical protein
MKLAEKTDATFSTRLKATRKKDKQEDREKAIDEERKLAVKAKKALAVHTGRIDMLRSKPADKLERKVEKVEHESEEDDKKYFIE